MGRECGKGWRLDTCSPRANKAKTEAYNAPVLVTPPAAYAVFSDQRDSNPGQPQRIICTRLILSSKTLAPRFSSTRAHAIPGRIWSIAIPTAECSVR
jgi:hypothetical protein